MPHLLLLPRFLASAIKHPAVVVVMSPILLLPRFLASDMKHPAVVVHGRLSQSLLDNSMSCMQCLTEYDRANISSGLMDKVPDANSISIADDFLDAAVTI